jgi:hypothetical protein
MGTEDIRARIQRNAQTPRNTEPSENEDTLTRIRREASEHAWQVAKERERLQHAVARAEQERHGE